MKAFEINGKWYKADNYIEASNYCYYLSFWSLNNKHQRFVFISFALFFEKLKVKEKLNNAYEYLTLENNNYESWL